MFPLVRYFSIASAVTIALAIIAVTVIATNATDADALATGLFVLGPERGIELVERLEGVEALIVDPGMAVRRASGFPALD